LADRLETAVWAAVEESSTDDTDRGLEDMYVNFSQNQSMI